MLESADLRGRRALITGAAKRLGRETTLTLARRGVSIALHYNSSAAEAEALAEEVRDLGVRATTLPANLEQPDQAESLFDAACESLGGLDLLVNNASIFPEGRLGEMTLEEVDRNLRVNAWAPFLLTRALWRRVRGREAAGSVVNLLDTRLVGGDLAHAPYHLSKSLLAELTNLSALEFAPELRVNGVAPGAVLPPEGMDEDYLAALTHDLPLRRRGYPGDIAEAVVYLLQASFVTGQVIFVDGGRHLRLGGST